MRRIYFRHTNYLFRLVLTLSLVACIPAIATAQDIHFTQFDFNPLFLNPANTGNFNGDLRAAVNYRNQWAASSPFVTTSVSLEKQFIVLSQNIAVGIFLLNDVSGPISLKTKYNKVYGSAGYSTKIGENYFNIGFQFGFTFGATSSSEWGIWNRTTGMWDLPSGEATGGLEKSLYPDINLGAIWKRNISIFEPEAGLSISHINRPNQAFTSGIERVPLGIAVHGSVKTKINDEIYIKPKLFYTGERKTSLLILGAEGGYNLLGNRSSVKKIFGGVYLRNGFRNAFMAQAGTTIGRLDLALSYDIAVSDINQSGNMGAFEISLIYRSISTVLNSYSIPCERY